MTSTLCKLHCNLYNTKNHLQTNKLFRLIFSLSTTIISCRHCRSKTCSSHDHHLVAWTTAVHFCMVYQTTSSRSCSLSRTLRTSHHWNSMWTHHRCVTWIALASRPATCLLLSRLPGVPVTVWSGTSVSHDRHPTHLRQWSSSSPFSIWQAMHRSSHSTQNTFSDRSFCIVGPRVWNRLPMCLRSEDISYRQFR